MPYLLWILGLALILAEFYLPGAIMGVAGGIALFSSLILFASTSTSPVLTFLFILSVLASVALLIPFALWRIRTAKPESSIYSNASQTGFVASHYDKTAIGKKGVVTADLKPGGYIQIEGKQHQALSQSGYLAKGEEVLVLSGQEESLIVKSTKKGSTS